MNGSLTDGERQVLIVDDDEALLRSMARPLMDAGYGVKAVSAASLAILELESQRFDVVISDIYMSEMSGIELLQAVRIHDPDTSVLLVTGTPGMATALSAMEHGALRYLIKPVTPEELLAVVAYAGRMCRMARVKREALLLLGDPEKFVGDHASMEASFARAFDRFWMAYQPIVTWSARTVYAYEALLRSSEATMLNPGSFLTAAEKLGRLPELGSAIRHAVAGAARLTTSRLFVNLHALDLNDERLYSVDAPLSEFARHVVLEITERASLDIVKDVPARLNKLRDLGYKVALDDLGAGYAGLTSLALLQPDLVKLDISLVRDVDKSDVKQRLVGTMVTLLKEMKMSVVAEGVETVGERDALIHLGCDLFQGYLFARPGRPFPVVTW